MPKMNTIGIVKVPNNIGHAGVGYVVIPDGVDIDTYVQDCYRNNTVTLWGGVGYGYFSDVHVDESVMQLINFPSNPTKLNRGSAVVWIKDDTSQRPVVIASLRNPDDYFPLAPNQWRMAKSVDDKRIVEMYMDADTASLVINISGDKDDAGDLNIKVTSEKKDSVINVECDNAVNVSGNTVNVLATESSTLSIVKDGITQTSVTCKADDGVKATVRSKVEISVTDDDKKERAKVTYEVDKGMEYSDEYDNSVILADGEMKVKIASDKAEIGYKKDEGFAYKDQFNNEINCANGEVIVKSQTIKEEGNIQHNNGTEPMVKGQTLMQWLNDLCTAILALTVTTPMGPSGPPINAAQFAALQGQLQNILSQKSKLD